MIRSQIVRCWLFGIATIPAAAVAERPAVPTGMTDKELIELAHSIEREVGSGKSSFLTSRLDFAGIAEWATGKARTEYAIGFRNGFIQSRTFMQRQMDSEMRNGGSYRFLGLKGAEPSRTLFFRLLTGKGALNYHEVRVARKGEGEWQATDLKPYINGQWLSETAKQEYVDAREAAEHAEGANATDEEKAILAEQKDVLQLATIWPKDPIQALKIHDRLPEAVQKKRNVAVMRLQAAMRADDQAEYEKALETFEQMFPDDPGKEMILLDALFLKQRYEEMIATVDRLREIIGVDDAYLDCFRGIGRRFNGESDKAIALYRSAIQAEPDLRIAHQALLDLAMAESNFDLAVEALAGLEEKCKVNVDEIVQRPPFAEFRLSDSYANWQKGRAKGKRRSEP